MQLGFKGSVKPTGHAGSSTTYRPIYELCSVFCLPSAYEQTRLLSDKMLVNNHTAVRANTKYVPQ